MTTAVQQIKHLLNLSSFEGYDGLVSHIEKLVKERDEALQLRQAYNSNVKDWRELCGYFNLPVSTLSDVMSAIDTMRKERDALMSMRNDLETLIKGNEYWKGNTFDSVTRLIEIATAPDVTQPQLSEIRYVLHGDIQPCSVLYRDDTTTLLRLDEGDMMLETDTIEWSDSVTYRCQELLKASGLNRINTVRVSGHLAQLVRDERILLNDNGDDELGADEAYFRDDLVVQVRKPDASDSPFLRHSPVGGVEQPCEECGHVFDAQSMRCPMCAHTRSVAFSHDMQPKQER